MKLRKFLRAAGAVLVAAVLLLPPQVGAVGPALAASEAYVVMDADTGLVLEQQNMNEELHPASITKVLTLGLACQKAAGDWSVPLTVSHEDVYSLAGTDSSHIALQEGETAPLQDLLYATMMASANDGANVLAEYIGGGTIADGVAAMNDTAAALGLSHSHFANPHGISDENHYTSCYDMAVILRWALQQPGFRTLFCNSEMYTMQPTNVQPVTRYFSQQDKMRVGSSRYHIASILGSKIGYTNIARYTYVCLAEQNDVRLICVVMKSELKTDKYADVAAILNDAFARFSGYTQVPGAVQTQTLTVRGGGGALGEMSVSDPGARLLLADGLSAENVSVRLEMPAEYVLGTPLTAWAVYTVDGQGMQENAELRLPAAVSGLDAVLTASLGAPLENAADTAPEGTAAQQTLRIFAVLGAAAVLCAAVLCGIRVKNRRKRAAARRKRLRIEPK